MTHRHFVGSTQEVDKIDLYDQWSGKDGHFMKCFLISDKINLNKWVATWEAIQRDVYDFIGRPIVLTDDVDHPEVDEQDKHKVGEIIDIHVHPAEHMAYAIAKIDDGSVWAKLKKGLYRYMSPAVTAKDSETIKRGEIAELRRFEPQHHAIVARPAYGVVSATIDGFCDGTGDRCKKALTFAASLLAAKQETIQVPEEDYEAASRIAFEAMCFAMDYFGGTFKPKPGEKPHTDGYYYRTVRGRKIRYKPGDDMGKVFDEFQKNIEANPDPIYAHKMWDRNDAKTEVILALGVGDYPDAMKALNGFWKKISKDRLALVDRLELNHTLDSDDGLLGGETIYRTSGHQDIRLSLQAVDSQRYKDDHGGTEESVALYLIGHEFGHNFHYQLKPEHAIEIFKRTKNLTMTKYIREFRDKPETAFWYSWIKTIPHQKLAGKAFEKGAKEEIKSALTALETGELSDDQRKLLKTSLAASEMKLWKAQYAQFINNHQHTIATEMFAEWSAIKAGAKVRHDVAAFEKYSKVVEDVLGDDYIPLFKAGLMDVKEAYRIYVRKSDIEDSVHIYNKAGDWIGHKTIIKKGRTHKADEDGKWRTINGHRVFLPKGKEKERLKEFVESFEDKVSKMEKAVKPEADKAFEQEWQEKYAAKWDKDLDDDSEMYISLANFHKREIEPTKRDFYLDGLRVKPNLREWVEKNLDGLNKAMETDFTIADFKVQHQPTKNEAKKAAEYANMNLDAEFKPEDFDTSDKMEHFLHEHPGYKWIVSPFIGSKNKIGREFRSQLDINPEKFKELLKDEEKFQKMLEQKAEIAAIRKKRWDRAKSFYRGLSLKELKGISASGKIGYKMDASGNWVEHEKISASVSREAANKFGTMRIEFDKEPMAGRAKDVNYSPFSDEEYSAPGHPTLFLNEEEYVFFPGDRPEHMKIHISFLPQGYASKEDFEKEMEHFADVVWEEAEK